MIRNRVVALIFRLASFAFILAGLWDHLGFSEGVLRLGSFMYYTIQSNLLALALFGILTVRTAMGLKRDGAIGKTGYFARFEMVCVIDLLLTLIVYWVLLAPTSFSMGSDHSLWAFDNLAVHLVTPLLCLVDYILFTESHHLKYRDVYYVLIYPLFYVAFTSVAGLLGYVYRISSADGQPVRFPYFFFDFDRVGAFSLVYIGGLIVFFLLLSHGLYWLDKRVTKPVLLPRGGKAARQ